MMSSGVAGTLTKASSFMLQMSNLIVDHLARRLTTVTAVTHTLVILGAIYVLEHVTAHHRDEFRSDRQKSAELMARLREAYRDPEDASKETETASKVLNEQPCRHSRRS
jgi:hypothetical protein